MNLQNELYISPSWDVNPLESINGKAKVMSVEDFQKAYPQGKVPRSSTDHGKIFVCRRGCNTRTATYTEEFVWEDVYRGAVDLQKLIERVKSETKATRRKSMWRRGSPDALYDVAGDGGDGSWGQTGSPRKPSTPRKPRTDQGTPKKPKPTTPSSHRK